jgi:hypothetical protein
MGYFPSESNYVEWNVLWPTKELEWDVVWATGTRLGCSLGQQELE